MWQNAMQGILSHLDFERRTSCYIMCKWSCTGKKNKNIAYIIDFERRKSCKVLVKCQGYQVPTWEPRKYIESILNQNS